VVFAIGHDRLYVSLRFSDQRKSTKYVPEGANCRRRYERPETSSKIGRISIFARIFGADFLGGLVSLPVLLFGFYVDDPDHNGPVPNFFVRPFPLVEFYDPSAERRRLAARHAVSFGGQTGQRILAIDAFAGRVHGNFSVPLDFRFDFHGSRVDFDAVRLLSIFDPAVHVAPKSEHQGRVFANAPVVGGCSCAAQLPGCDPKWCSSANRIDFAIRAPNSTGGGGIAKKNFFFIIKKIFFYN